MTELFSGFFFFRIMRAFYKVKRQAGVSEVFSSVTRGAAGWV